MMSNPPNVSGSNISINNSVLNDIKGNQNNYYIGHGSPDERLTIGAWISPLNFKATQLDVFQKRTPNTGQWLLESPEFNTWLVGGSETLWCPGIPGAGKTVLVSSVVDHIQTRVMHDNPEIACIYCYCNYKEQKTQTVPELIASLLKQLVQDHPTISDNVKTLYNRHIVQNTRPTPDEFTKALQSEIGRYAKVYIIVDALDEFLERDQGYLITELQSLSGNINLMVTSRPLPLIEEQFHGARRLNILANDKDIRIYIESRIPRERRLVQHVKKDVTLLETMMDKIGTTARGMFLLAELHMNTLVTKSNPQAVRNTLENLPTEVNATYDEAMERIANQGEDDRQLAERVLSWVLYAFRPLSLEELQYALSVYPNADDIDANAIENETIFISVCAGLVTIDEGSPRRVIRLIHYTTQQYLESRRQLLFPNAPAYISLTCLTYLSFGRFRRSYCVHDKEFESLLKSNPLLFYAAVHWGRHTRGAVEETHRETVLNFLQKTENVACATQVMLTSQYPRYSTGYSQRFPKGFSGMHLLSFCGLGNILLHQLENGARADFMDEQGRAPLWYAAQNGHEEVVRLLVEKGNVKDVDGRTPLSIAAANGHDAVVRLLVAREGIDLNCADWDGQTPLLLAAVNGHERVVRLLLAEAGIDVNFRDANGRSSLWWAAETGHEAVVKLLMARDDIELDCKDQDGLTPFFMAVADGREPVVRLLLAEAGINVNLRAANGDSPLSLAVERRNEAIVRLLMTRGDIELNPKDKLGRTPLLTAIMYREESIVRLLLAGAGIDVNCSDRSDHSPLSYTVKFGPEEIVRLLVARDDIELNRRSPWNGWETPLLSAVNSGQEAVVELLLADARVDVNGSSPYDHSLLSCAARDGKEAVVMSLLAHDNVELNCDCRGWTPLLLAAVNEDITLTHGSSGTP